MDNYLTLDEMNRNLEEYAKSWGTYRNQKVSFSGLRGSIDSLALTGEVTSRHFIVPVSIVYPGDTNGNRFLDSAFQAVRDGHRTILSMIDEELPPYIPRVVV
jgi:hypothetical protein